jgi:Zn-dependent M28 family amino/carboxypeptidase
MKVFSEKYSIVCIPVIMLVAFTFCQREPEMTKEEYVEHVVSQVRSDSLKSYVRWLEGMGTRFALADNHREVAASIKKRLAGFGYPDARLDSFYLTKTYREVTYSTWQYNVTATIPGSSDDSITIVGAHYDDAVATGDPFTFAPGANDNASGVAAVMEIARVMKKNRFQPQHTIMFTAFAAEELGLNGSLDQAAKAGAAGDKIMMMINYDMIAYLANAAAKPWYLNIINYDNSLALRDQAAAICTASSSLMPYSDNTNYNRSDSYSFFLNGFPALFFHQSDIESTYHTVGDVTSVCNFEYCREIARASCALVIDKNF